MRPSRASKKQITPKHLLWRNIFHYYGSTSKDYSKQKSRFAFLCVPCNCKRPNSYNSWAFNSSKSHHHLWSPLISAVAQATKLLIIYTDWKQNQSVIQSGEQKKPCFLTVCTAHMRPALFSAPSTSHGTCSSPALLSSFWGILMATSINVVSKLPVSVHCLAADTLYNGLVSACLSLGGCTGLGLFPLLLYSAAWPCVIMPLQSCWKKKTLQMGAVCYHIGLICLES